MSFALCGGRKAHDVRHFAIVQQNTYGRGRDYLLSRRWLARAASSLAARTSERIAFYVITSVAQL